MSQAARSMGAKVWTAKELRVLPPAERDAILAAAAAAAEYDYRTDPELTAFDAFDEDGSNGEGAST
jgi:hypothetical protein